MDFLAGNQSYQCTPWGSPTRNVFGWQKPCYLLVGEGYAPTFKALVEETEWDRYGSDRNPKCAQCMAHCGYEPAAVEATFGSLRGSLGTAWLTLLGPGGLGRFQGREPVRLADSPPSTVASLPPRPA